MQVEGEEGMAFHGSRNTSFIVNGWYRSREAYGFGSGNMEFSCKDFCFLTEGEFISEGEGVSGKPN